MVTVLIRTAPMLQCIRCKHNWKQRGERLPMRCPSCRSASWHSLNGRNQPDYSVVPGPEIKYATPSEARRHGRIIMKKYDKMFRALADGEWHADHPQVPDR